MDSKNFAIGTLSTTAVILLVGLVITNTHTEDTWASGMTVSGGDYVLTVGADPTGDEELLYVIDAPAQKLIVYRFDAGRSRIELLQKVDLAEMRSQPAQQQPGRSGTPRGRRP